MNDEEMDRAMDEAAEEGIFRVRGEEKKGGGEERKGETDRDT